MEDMGDGSVCPMLVYVDVWVGLARWSLCDDDGEEEEEASSHSVFGENMPLALAEKRRAAATRVYCAVYVCVYVCVVVVVWFNIYGDKSDRLLRKRRRWNLKGREGGKILHTQSYPHALMHLHMYTHSPL